MHTASLRLLSQNVKCLFLSSISLFNSVLFFNTFSSSPSSSSSPLWTLSHLPLLSSLPHLLPLSMSTPHLFPFVNQPTSVPLSTVQSPSITPLLLKISFSPFTPPSLLLLHPSITNPWIYNWLSLLSCIYFYPSSISSPPLSFTPPFLKSIMAKRISIIFISHFLCRLS